MKENVEHSRKTRNTFFSNSSQPIIEDARGRVFQTFLSVSISLPFVESVKKKILE